MDTFSYFPVLCRLLCEITCSGLSVVYRATPHPQGFLNFISHTGGGGYRLPQPQSGVRRKAMLKPLFHVSHGTNLALRWDSIDSTKPVTASRSAYRLFCSESVTGVVATLMTSCSGSRQF